jgi:dUTP pyrophosphatase
MENKLRKEYGFEIVRDDELKKWNLSKEDIIMPRRKTKFSAGYDLHTPIGLRVETFTNYLIPTGLKCKMPNDYCMKISLRSGFANKNNITMLNAEGLIDSDYYGNVDNDGHIFLGVFYLGKETLDPFHLKKGVGVAQAKFEVYKTFSDVVEEVRVGGLGSTGT